MRGVLGLQPLLVGMLGVGPTLRPFASSGKSGVARNCKHTTQSR